MDLSKVLGDVYADNASSRTPEWADEAHLDQAFADWTPGPPADAPAAEREMASHVESTSRRRIDDDLAGALTEALTAVPSPSPVAEFVAEIPEPPKAVEPVRVWSRGDDDVLPGRSGAGRKRRLSLR